MKKIQLIALALFSLNTAYSFDGIINPENNFTVVSDLVDKKIKKGTFVIQGEVRMFSSNFPLEHCKVGSLQSENFMMTGADGRFTLLCNSATDSTFYIYQDGWAEITIGNYDFKDRHRVTITAYAHQEFNHVKRKPVIYLYSETELTASVKINPMGEFTFTYPFYNEGWNVTVDNSGTLRDAATNKTYPYLFWEAESSNLFYQTVGNTIPGFIINTDSTIQFLENTLTLLGLNSTEITDFITFWGPIIEHDNFALIQFVVDDAYESRIAQLEISPKPDAVRRVYILCSPIPDSVVGMDVVPQTFTNFERKGFTVVEWGGSEIDLTNLKP